MKYLISTIMAFALVFSSGSVALAESATQRFWSVNISEPTSTTNKKMNIRYQVSSTVKNDTFTVELFENGKPTPKASEGVTHEYGDSGVFEFNLPSAGTYTYKITATNHGDSNATKDTKEVSVNVSDEPEPVVTTVVVNRPANNAGFANTNNASTAGQDDGAGTVAAANDDGSQAPSDDNEEQAPDSEGDVLGDEESKTDEDEEQNGSAGWTIGLTILALAATYFGLTRYKLPRN